MDLPTALAAHLRDLADSVGSGDDPVAEALASLRDELQAAVSSYAGLRLTLVLDGWPITLTAFPGIDGVSPATSLRVALTVLGDGFDPDSELILYARTPGGFVDLAADLDYLRRRGRIPADGGSDGGGHTDGDGHRPAIALDADLPPVSVVSEITGLAEYSVINRAVGVLIWRGQAPDQALGTLRREATTAGLTLPGYAARFFEE